MKKNIFKTAAAVLLALLAIGCGKPYEYPYALRVNSHLVHMPKDETTTPVIIYSNTTWSASLVDAPSWASLDRESGSGIGEVRFTCSENKGMARMVKIALATAAERDTVKMLQLAALSDPAFYAAKSSFEISSDSSDEESAFVTQLTPEEFERIEIGVKCPDYDDPWIVNLRLSEDKILFSVKENTSGKERVGSITLSFVDAAGTGLSTTITIYQAA